MALHCVLNHTKANCSCIPTEAEVPQGKFTLWDVVNFAEAARKRLINPHPAIDIKYEYLVKGYANETAAIWTNGNSPYIVRVRHSHIATDNFPWRLDFIGESGDASTNYFKAAEVLKMVGSILSIFSQVHFKAWIAENYECL